VFAHQRAHRHTICDPARSEGLLNDRECLSLYIYIYTYYIQVYIGIRMYQRAHGHAIRDPARSEGLLNDREAHVRVGASRSRGKVCVGNVAGGDG